MDVSQVNSSQRACLHHVIDKHFSTFAYTPWKSPGEKNVIEGIVLFSGALAVF